MLWILKEILKEELNSVLHKRIMLEANEKFEDDAFISHMAIRVCCGASSYRVSRLGLWDPAAPCHLGKEKEPFLHITLSCYVIWTGGS